MELYNEIKTLNEVPSESAPRENMRRVLNTLDLIGLSVKLKMVDRIVVRDFFGEDFVRLYNQVQATGIVPGFGKKGLELLSECHSARWLYKELQTEKEKGNG